MIVWGIPARTQAKITIDVPFPIPISVMRSQSQRRTMVPAVMMSIAGKTTPQKFEVSRIGAHPFPPMRVLRRRIIP
jgi:hypothetical protein